MSFRPLESSRRDRAAHRAADWRRDEETQPKQRRPDPVTKPDYRGENFIAGVEQAILETFVKRSFRTHGNKPAHRLVSAMVDDAEGVASDMQATWNDGIPDPFLLGWLVKNAGHESEEVMRLAVGTTKRTTRYPVELYAQKLSWVISNLEKETGEGFTKLCGRETSWRRHMAKEKAEQKRKEKAKEKEKGKARQSCGHSNGHQTYRERNYGL